MQEVWKQIEGYKGDYEISNFGRVKSKKNPKHIILKPRNNQGYFKVNLCMLGKIKFVYIHRLVAMAFLPNPDGKKYVNHIDCNKLNNRVDNLEWVTHGENVKHAVKNGRFDGHRGENAYNSKLTDSAVKSIRKMYNQENMTQKQIANMFGVTQALIHMVVSKQLWTHV